MSRRRPRRLSPKPGFWGLSLFLLLVTMPLTQGFEPGKKKRGDAVPVVVERETECLAAEVVAERVDDGLGLAVPLPGTSIAYALARRADGRRDAVVLVAPYDAEDAADPGRDAQAIAELMALSDGNGSVKLEIDGDASWESIVKALEESRRWRCPSDEDVERLSLVRVSFDDPPVVTRFPGEIPESSRAVLALDADGDGVDEIYVETPGTLQRVDEGMIVVIEDRELHLGLENPRDVDFPEEVVAIRSPLQSGDETPARRRPRPGQHVDPSSSIEPFVRVTGLGGLRFYDPHRAPDRWEIAATVPLPVRSHPDRTRLALASPQVRHVFTDGSRSLFAAGPVPHGGNRLQTILIEIDDTGETTVREAWSRMPDGDDQLDRSGYLRLDGEPYLWVISHREKAIQFGSPDDRLTVFRLTDDRTRAGGPPVLALEKAGAAASGLKLARDVDGDGREDLVSVSRDDDAVIQAYLQKEDGSFSRSPRKQTVPFEGHPWFGVGDLDRDGEDELILVVEDQVAIYDWLDGSRGLLEATPRVMQRPLADATWSGAQRRSSSRIDLDGDGGVEWITLLGDKAASSYIEMIRFPSAR